MSDKAPSSVSPRTVVALGVLLVGLLIAAIVGGVFAWLEYDRQSELSDSAAEYGDVLASADRQAEAFVNIDYRDFAASIEAVREGATGEFREQYDESSESVVAVLEQNESVMDGEVIWSGVSTIDKDSARVFAYTNGTVSNVQSNNEPVERNFRLQLDLIKVKGQWLTNNLEFVG